MEGCRGRYSAFFKNDDARRAPSSFKAVISYLEAQLGGELVGSAKMLGILLVCSDYGHAVCNVAE